jgi:hypothetical protein
LVTRKLEAVRGALSSLSTELPGSPVEVYDRPAVRLCVQLKRGFDGCDHLQRSTRQPCQNNGPRVR